MIVKQIYKGIHKLRLLFFLYSWMIGVGDFHIAAADNTLVQAILKKNLKEVTAVVDKGASLYERDPYGGTPLHLAVHKGAIAIAKLLIARGAPINAICVENLHPPLEKEKCTLHGYYRGTPLHIAVARGDRKMVALLVKHGATLNSCEGGIMSLEIAGVGETPLQIAVKNGNIALATWLLKKGAPVNDSNDDITALNHALSSGLRMVKLLIDYGAHVNTLMMGNSILDYASYQTPQEERSQIIQLLCKKGARSHSRESHDCVTYLVGKGASLHSKDKEGNTPLHAAVQKNGTCCKHNKVCLGLTQVLSEINNRSTQQNAFPNKSWEGNNLKHVKQHIPIDQPFQKGYAPLHMEIQMGHSTHYDDKIYITHGYTRLHLAAYKGDVALTRSLLKQGANVNAIDTQYGCTPLHLAACQGREKVVKLLLRHQAFIHAKEKGLGRTPLHLAAATGNSATVQYLIHHGATIDSMDQNSWIPLHAAIAAHNATEVIKLLLDQGGVMHKTSKGDTPLHFAAKEKDIESMRYLIQKGANVNMVNKVGHTPLHCAAKQGAIEGCKLLVAMGAAIDPINKKGRTPLYMACHAGTESIEFMIKGGAEVKAQNKEGRTPLHWAARNALLFEARLLLQCGADINALDYEGNTPLHVAVLKRDIVLSDTLDVVALLVENGSNVNHKNKSGKTPLDLAIQNGFNTQNNWDYDITMLLKAPGCHVAKERRLQRLRKRSLWS